MVQWPNQFPGEPCPRGDTGNSEAVESEGREGEVAKVVVARLLEDRLEGRMEAVGIREMETAGPALVVVALRSSWKDGAKDEARETCRTAAVASGGESSVVAGRTKVC